MQSNQNNILGIDIGGTITKLGLVNIKTGEVTEHHSFLTPKNLMPNEIFSYIKPYVPKNCSAIGFALPCIVKNDIIKTAPKDPRWIGLNFNVIAKEYFQVDCFALNDADAAAIAEINFGTMKHLSGVTILVTLGTGIGTAIYNNGSLLFNTEFGRMAMPGCIDNAEEIASVSAKNNENLNWQEYSKRIDLYLSELNRLYWPDHIVIGGGVSESWNEWSDFLSKSSFQIHKATMGNKAGIIGAAIQASKKCIH